MGIAKNKIQAIFIISILMLFMPSDGIFKYVITLGITYILFLPTINSKYYDEDNIYYLELFLPQIFYICYSIIIIFIKGNFEQIPFFIKESIFISLPILTAILIVRYWGRYNLPKIFFYIISIVFFITTLKRFNTIDLLESTEAFIFGYYCIYYIVKKNFKYSIFSLIFMYLANKRIAILSFFITIFIYFFIRNKNNKMNRYIFILFIFITFIYIKIIKDGSLTEIIHMYGINDMGRSNIYSRVNHGYEVSLFFLGNGLGWVMNELAKYNIKYAANLHNDILKLYIETGFWGYITYMFIYSKIFKKISEKDKENGKLIFIMYIYTFILYLTDNVSIYIYYLIPFYTLIFYEIRNKALIKKK